MDSSYGFVVPDSCASVSFTVAMALSRQIVVRAHRAVANACTPKLCERIDTIAKACAPKLCTVERIGQEAEAKIGVILALRR